MSWRHALITASILCLGVAAPLSTLAADAPPAAGAQWGPTKVANQTLAPGEKKKFTFLGERTFEGSFVDFPIFAAHGRKPGRRLCVTSAIHGDEINSVEIARRAFAHVDTNELAGTLVVIPAVNTAGFRRGDRYMPDRRDLNRFFPGNPNGSVASLVAYIAFDRVLKGCTHLIDLHTGSNARSNSPQIRVDSKDPEAMAMARHFEVGIIVDGAGPSGSLRREAMKVGIKSIIYEAGPPLVFLEPEIDRGVLGIENVMAYLGMTKARIPRPKGKMLVDDTWIRVPVGQGGIYLPIAPLGKAVKKGELLARITDPITDVMHEIQADRDGMIVGMALPQVVLSGYGLFHVGVLEDR